MHESDEALARELIGKHGWNTTCFQILNPGIEPWFGVESVVGFVRRRGVRIVAGAPVVDPSRLRETMESFERAEGRTPVCYFGAESRLHTATQSDPRYCSVVVGAQPFWNPASWLRNVESVSSLRAQIHRAANKGVTASEWSRARVKGEPRLRACLDDWLGTRGLPPMHFLNEPEVLDRPEGRRFFVIERAGGPVGFVVLAPVPARRGWLTELFVRGSCAPNGAIELGLTEAVRTIAEERAGLVTMGMVPLSPEADQQARNNPGWLRFMGGWSRLHMRRFYNFSGLNYFKSKFQPDYWEPIYAVANEPRFKVRTLGAVVGAFTQISPFLAAAKGLSRAVAQEAAWLVHGRR